jgi:hypothetical protein
MPMTLIHCNRVNCRTGLKETRNLMTGLHICEDLFCMHCNACIGWKYVEAQDPEQKYKVGDITRDIFPWALRITTLMNYALTLIFTFYHSIGGKVHYRKGEAEPRGAYYRLTDTRVVGFR